MQLREILDLEAMLTKDPAPESLEDEEEDDGEISEKNAGVSFKDEDEVEEEPEADSDDEEGGSAKKRESFEEDEEDNTLSLAAMEELLKPDALEKFAAITKSRSEEHTSELQSLMRISYAVFCLKKKK